MTPMDVQPIVDAALALLVACRGEEPGTFVRSPVSGEDTPRGAPDPEATAAAANLLYMLGVFPGRSQEREQWVQALRSFADKETGWVMRGNEPDVTATAACVAALECFDVSPRHGPGGLNDQGDPKSLPHFLESLDWGGNPWSSGEQAAALYTLLVLSTEVGHDWEDAWFAWIAAETDEHTGLIRRGSVNPSSVQGQWTLWPHLAGVTPLLATHVHARRPHPLPWRMIDTLLEMLEINRPLFSVDLECRELPLVFSLSRSLRLTPHRHEESLRALRRFSQRHLSFLKQQVSGGAMEDLVQASRVICLLAELQHCLPGFLRTRRPLRQILDRRPSI